MQIPLQYLLPFKAPSAGNPRQGDGRYISDRNELNVIFLLFLKASQYAFSPFGIDAKQKYFEKTWTYPSYYCLIALTPLAMNGKEYEKFSDTKGSVY